MEKIDWKNINKSCDNCGGLLLLKTRRDLLKKRFCSRRCNFQFILKKLHSNPEFTRMVVLACNTTEANKKKGRKGITHPNWKGGNQTYCCQICRKSFEIPINRSNKGYGRFCSRSCYNKYHVIENVKSQCLNCGEDIWDKPKRKRVYCSCSCRAIHLLPKQKFKNTGIELKIKSFLERSNIPFLPQPLIKNIVNADFLIGTNIVIFADGDYWHSLPYAINRDRIVNQQLENQNYTILRFKEKDINNNFEIVQNKIMETYHAII